jgi:hypothetical protein
MACRDPQAAKNLPLLNAKFCEDQRASSAPTMPMVSIVIHTMSPRLRRQNRHHGRRPCKELGIARKTLYPSVCPKRERRVDGTKPLKSKARTDSSCSIETRSAPWA